MDNVKFSKRITYILRHDPYGAGLTPDKFGFVPIDKLLFALGEKFPKYSNITFKDIRNVMEDSEKKRFEIFGNLIRHLTVTLLMSCPRQVQFLLNSFIMELCSLWQITF